MIILYNPAGSAESKYDRLDRELSALQDRVYNLEKENQLLREQVQILEQKLDRVMTLYASRDEDYQTLREELEAIKKSARKDDKSFSEKDWFSDKKTTQKFTPKDPIRGLYNQAYELYNLGEYQSSIEHFNLFLARNASSDLADNAKYWVGECYYAMGDYAQALQAFVVILREYSGGNKVPEAYLRTGYCYESLGEQDKALEVYRDVANKFPGTAVAGKAESKISVMSIH